MPKHNILSPVEFKSVLPKKFRKSVNDKLINRINKILASPDTIDTLRDNILSFTSVLANGRFKLSSYLNAVNYVSHKLLGATNTVAYIKTFPGKYDRFIKQGVPTKDIASYITAYNKSKLVNLIYEQTLVPSHILNAPMYQEALNTQAELMRTAKSEKVRSDAANSILTHLKPPEKNKIELDIGIKQDTSIIDELREATQKLAEQQRINIMNKHNSVQQTIEAPLQIGLNND